MKYLRRCYALLLIFLFLFLFDDNVDVVYAAEDKGQAEVSSSITVFEKEVSSYSDILVDEYSFVKSSDNYWAKFGSCYYYNQMTETQRTLYDSLYNMCMGYLTGTEDIDGAPLGGQGNGEFTEGIQYEGLTSTEAIDVTQIFVNSNPQFYFLAGQNYVREYFLGNDTSGVIYIDVYSEFIDGDIREQYTMEFQTIIDDWLLQINKGQTPEEKERKAYDLVLGNSEYDETATFNQSCYSILKNGKSVCAGYAEAFELLCNGAGIETIIVTSTSHEWCQVRLNGNWYAVDPTWGDTAKTENYYNVSDESVKKNNMEHIPESVWSRFNRPECKYDYGKEMSSSNNEYVAIYEGTDYASIFDPYYYADNYPDLKNAFGYNGAKLLEHFVNNGMKEGRQAKISFNVTSYRLMYPDLRRAFNDDLEAYYIHYLNYGEKEGRQAVGCTTMQGAETVLDGIDYSSVYDYQFYVSNNPDVYNAFGSDDVAVLNHFVNCGMSEKRRGNSSFDVTSYYLQYEDLRRAFDRDYRAYYMHYIQYGKNEGRKTIGCATMQNAITVLDGVDYSLVYDYSQYVIGNPDVYSAFGDDDLAILNHFVNYGMNEGRVAKENFHVNIYKSLYSDLRNAYGDDWESYYLHYLYYGKNEGRRAV